jgi:4'-phosphopantetheinyl transferase
VAAYACTVARAIGIDLEAIRYHNDLAAVARALFSPSERNTLDRLNGADWTEGFYRCWTRKEAYVKALGCGLLAPLDEFDVGFEVDQPAALLRVRGSTAEAGRWEMSEVSVPAGYVAALVAERA